MPRSMKNDDAALVKEMKSGPPREKKVESAGGVENRRVAKAERRVGGGSGGCRASAAEAEERELIPCVGNNSVSSSGVEYCRGVVIFRLVRRSTFEYLIIDRNARTNGFHVFVRVKY